MNDQSLDIVVDNGSETNDFIYANTAYTFGSIADGWIEFVLDGMRWQEEPPTVETASVWVYGADGVKLQVEHDVVLAEYLPADRINDIEKLIAEVTAGGKVSVEGSQLIVDALEEWHMRMTGYPAARYLTIGSV